MQEIKVKKQLRRLIVRALFWFFLTFRNWFLMNMFICKD